MNFAIRFMTILLSVKNESNSYLLLFAATINQQVERLNRTADNISQKIDLRHLKGMQREFLQPLYNGC